MSNHAYFEQIRLPATRAWRLLEVIETADDMWVSLVLTANLLNNTPWSDDVQVEAVKATSNQAPTLYTCTPQHGPDWFPLLARTLVSTYANPPGM